MPRRISTRGCTRLRWLRSAWSISFPLPSGKTFSTFRQTSISFSSGHVSSESVL